MRRLFRRRPDPRECEEVRALFSDFADEELGPKGRRQVEEHVGFCPACRQALANFMLTVRRLRGLSAATPPGAAGSDEITERLRRAWRDGPPGRPRG